MPSIPGLPQPGEQGDSDGDADSGSDQGDHDRQQRGSESQGGGPLGTSTVPQAEGQDSSEQEGGLVPQRSGDEAMSGSQEGTPEGEGLAGMPSSGAGEEEHGGQELEVDGNPGAGVLGEESDVQTGGTLDVNEEEQADMAGNPESSIPDEEEPLGGWEISNQLPDAERIRSAGSDGDDSENASGSDSDEASVDEALGQVLSDIDGSILAERAQQQEKANEQAGGPDLGDLMEDGTPGIADGANTPEHGSVGGSSTAAIPTVSDSSRRSEQGPNELYTSEDSPDAKDDDVIARQLREAAMAETDPEIREGLWEEYRRYTERNL